MNPLLHLRFSKKMFIVFGLIAALSLIQGAVALVSLYEIYSKTQEIDSYWMPSVSHLAQMRIYLGDARRQEFNAYICTDDACLQRYSKARVGLLDQIREQREQYREVVRQYSSPESDALDRQFDEDLASYDPVSERVMQLMGEGKRDEALYQLRDVNGKIFMDHVSKSIEQDIAWHRKGAAAATATAEHIYQRMKIAVISLVVFLVLGCMLIGRWLTNAVAPPLENARTILGYIADKDLTHQIELNQRDELGEMAISVNTTIGFFNDVLGTVTQSADSLTEATNSLMQSAKDSSLAAQMLCSQTQQVSANSQEMQATIKEISQNAEQAAKASRNSVQGAAEGGRVIDEAAETMSQIAISNQSITDRISALGEHSRAIGKIVTVIREISDQTNLLALNAAIESARAGEHGRGFAVVAGEVRRLAERAGTSAGEISSMIQVVQHTTEDIIQLVEDGRVHVDHGIERMNQARVALAEIVQLAQNSESMVEMIATAAQEQSAATAEISQTISQIAAIADKSATTSDQTASASQQLGALAQSLESVVGEFRLAS